MSETSCVSVLWEIENFPYCPHEKDENLCSPKFYVDVLNQSEWEISIFPNADEIEIFLHNTYLNKESSLFIDYEISFLSANGSVLWTGTKQNVRVNNDTSYSIDGYPEFGEVFVDRCDEYLNKDTLQIRCRLWKSRTTLMQPVLYLVHTRIGIETRFFHWAISEFSQLKTNEGKTTRKIKISKDKPTFCLEFSLKGSNANQEDVRIDMKQVNRNIGRIFCGCQISVLNTGGKVIKESDVDSCFFRPGEGSWTFQDFLTQNELTENKECLENDVLNLLFNVTFSTNENYSNIKYMSDTPLWVLRGFPRNSGIAEQLQNVPLSDAPSTSEEKARVETTAFLPDDLLSLNRDQTMSDFELRSRGKSFPVHKVILAARSPVFQAMFSSDMKETDVNFLEIPDLDGDTLQKLLMFIYTDEVKVSEWSIASNLYYAADKYEVLPLKQKCSSFLSDNISDSNVCEILSLADRHNDEALKSSVHDFIVHNDDKIIRSAKWNGFLESEPVLAAKTMQLVYSKKLDILAK